MIHDACHLAALEDDELDENLQARRVTFVAFSKHVCMDGFSRAVSGPDALINDGRPDNLYLAQSSPVIPPARLLPSCTPFCTPFSTDYSSTRGAISENVPAYREFSFFLCLFRCEITTFDLDVFHIAESRLVSVRGDPIAAQIPNSVCVEEFSPISDVSLFSCCPCSNGM